MRIFAYLLFFTSITLLSSQNLPPANGVISDDMLENSNSIVISKAKHFQILSVDRAILSEKKTVLILNKDAKSQGHLAVYYDKFESISNIRCAVYSADGKLIRKYKRSEIKDESTTSENLYDDNRVKYIEVNAPNYPYYVVSEYEKAYDGLFHYPTFWPQDNYHQGLLKSDFSVELPTSLGLRYLATFSDSIPSVAIEGALSRYSWHFENLAPKEKEIYSPPVAEVFPVVYLAPNKFKYDGYDGSMQTWSDFGAWLYSLLEGRSDLDPARIAEIRSLVAGKSDTKEKIRIVYQYLQANTRYVSVQLGIGGYQPFSVESVADHGYGDCKALTNYMRVMLDAIEIDSYYSVIGAGRTNKSFTYLDFPNSFQANHVILNIPLGADTMWLECTSQDSPCGYLGSFTQNRRALVVGPEGGQLIKTPSFSPEENIRKRIGKLRISKEGLMQGVIKTDFIGMQYESRRAQLLRSEPEQIKWILKQSELTYSVAELSYEFDDGAIPAISEEMQLHSESYGKISGNRLFFKPNVLSTWSEVPPVNKERKQDIVWPSAHYRADTLIIALPKNYKVEAQPADQHIVTPFGRYQTNITVNDSELQYVRRIEIPNGRYSRDSYDEFRSFLYEVAKADKAQVVLVEQKT